MFKLLRVTGSMTSQWDNFGLEIKNKNRIFYIFNQIFTKLLPMKYSQIILLKMNLNERRLCLDDIYFIVVIDYHYHVLVIIFLTFHETHFYSI